MVSATIPITKMTIIQAITSSILISSRAFSRFWPIAADVAAIHEQLTGHQRRQANAHPWLSPAT